MTSFIVCPSGFVSAVFLVLALSLAGIVHVLWLKSQWSKRFTQPLDAGTTFRDRRVFGQNKMLRGLMAMPPASALIFGLLGGMRYSYPKCLFEGLWDLTPTQYALLGFVCGLAFILAELPNSFLKRQFDVLPGAVPTQAWLRPVCFLFDRVDSTLGVLIVVSLVLPVSVMTWFWALVLGPVSHAMFSHWLHLMGEKARSL
jgi:hypothetical protein